MKERCIVIPAIKKNAVIPDQLVKKLAGITLIDRALNTARACAAGEDIITLTDSEEIGLICQRAGVRAERDQALRFHSLDIVGEMRGLLDNLASAYAHCVILRASCPLLTWIDLEEAWKKYRQSGADTLISVRAIRQRVWRSAQDNMRNIILSACGEDLQENLLVESRALIILNLARLSLATGRVIPYFLDERGIEIQDYQDWWICERLLERRHLVFVVAGYPAIGMGHVYRAMMLAHEISSHKITFVCTRESGLAVESVASRDYRVVRPSRTKAVVVPHLYGYVADMPDILALCRERGLICIEDAAQCVGSEIEGRKGGSFGDMAIFSFHSHKNLTTLGEGGMLYVRDPGLAALVPMLRHNGHCPYGGDRRDYWKPAMGNVDLPMLDGRPLMPSNYSIGEIECALGAKLLDRIDEINDQKRERAIRLIDELSDYPELEFHRVPTRRHNYHLLAVHMAAGPKARDRFIRAMFHKKGIKCVVQYLPLNRYDFYKKLGYGTADCPNADNFFDSMVSLPFQHQMSDADFNYLIESARDVLREAREKTD